MGQLTEHEKAAIRRAGAYLKDPANRVTGVYAATMSDWGTSRFSPDAQKFCVIGRLGFELGAVYCDASTDNSILPVRIRAVIAPMICKAEFFGHHWDDMSLEEQTKLCEAMENLQ